jgi:hypothetical protein
MDTQSLKTSASSIPNWFCGLNSCGKDRAFFAYPQVDEAVATATQPRKKLKSFEKKLSTQDVRDSLVQAAKYFRT